jgi:hypothetical protein
MLYWIVFPLTCFPLKKDKKSGYVCQTLTKSLSNADKVLWGIGGLILVVYVCFCN